jgi:hypothetical protein
MPSDNRFDNLLRNNLDGKPSRLPGDMLDRILEQNRKKRRLMFWWLNFTVGIYAIVLTVYLLGSNLNLATPARLEKTESAALAPQRHSDANTAGTIEKSKPENEKSEISKAAPIAAITGPNEISRSTGNIGSEPIIHTDVAGQAPADRNTQSNPPVQLPPIAAVATDPIIPKVPTDTAKPITTNPVVAASTAANTTIPESQVVQVVTPDSTPKKPQLVLIKNDTAKNKKRFFEGLHWDPFVSVGWMYERQKLGVSNMDTDRVHKDLPSLLGSASRPATGVQFNLGVQTTFMDKFRFQGGVQYAGMSNRVHVDYFIEEVPVIDIDGRIKGYLEVQDTFKTRVIIDREFRTSIISLPLQFGYSQKIGSKNEVVAGLGIRPQMHLVKQWVVPEDIYIINLNWTEMKQVFSAPAAVNLGYFRNEKHFTFGINAKWSPFFTAPKDLSNHVNLRTSQNEIGFLLMYRLQPKKR